MEFTYQIVDKLRRSYALDEKTVNRRITSITPIGTGISFKSLVFLFLFFTVNHIIRINHLKEFPVMDHQ